MYFQIKKTLLILPLFIASLVSAQDNKKAIELGLNFAGDETLFYGVYGKLSVPLSQKKHHFTGGVFMTVYNDFKGESTSEAYLKNDYDMRIIPNLYLGYSLNFNKLQLNVDIPVGASISITKGTLVNEKFDFERDYSNTGIFLNYGVSFTPKYQLNERNYIGAYTFVPLISDKARSGYQFGLGWTKTMGK